MSHGTFGHSENSTDEDRRGKGSNQASSATTPLP